MIVLLIILSVLAIILLSPISLRIKYDGKPQITARYLFLKHRILPEKENKKRIPIKKLFSKLFSKIKLKKKGHITEKSGDSHKKKKTSVSDILDFIKSASGFLAHILNSFLKHSKLKVSKIVIVVATEDASGTAIMYGVISQAVSYMLHIMDNFTTMKKSRRGEISVSPDFTTEESSINVDIKLQCSILGLIGVFFSALVYMAKKPEFAGSKNKKAIKQNRRNKKCRKTN